MPVFCIGVFLSFVAYFLVTIRHFWYKSWSVLQDFAILCGVAYYSDWSKRTDKIIKRERAAERAPKPNP